MSALLQRCWPIALVTGATAVWAVVPAINVQVFGSAVLLAPGDRRGLYSRSPGQVLNLSVPVGTRVAKDQVLVRLDRIDQAAPGGAAPTGQPQALDRQLEANADQQQGLVEQLRANTSEVEALRQQITTLQVSNQPVGQQLTALESLRQKQVIPTYSPLWVAAQDLYLGNKAAIRSLEAKIAQLEANRGLLQAQQAELRAVRAELEAVSQSLELRAPEPGRLVSWAVEEGQPVLPGERLGTLALERPSAASRQAMALFTEADATRLRVGAPIEIEPILQSRNQYGGTAQRYGGVEGTIKAISPTPLDAAALASVVGEADLALSLVARARQEAYGEGGDPLAILPGKATAPLMLVRVELESAPTPSGLRWSGGRGPDLRFDDGQPAEAKASVERRSLVSYALPFLRWIAGFNR
ncbi:hlyD secretion family protein [Synechococcus sp. RS9909]|nr:hlyD secretion family protein [Synechococcus sp. RS9909]